MNTMRRLPSAAMVLVLCSLGCQSQAPAPMKGRAQPPTPSTEHECQPVQELAALDPRTPVPLQPMMAWHQKQNMMEHLVVIQRITDGLARDDWTEVARAAGLIESSPQMQQMCEHMGAGAEGFTELALDFHRRAQAIGQAARAHDASRALQATANTLQACTACHAAFRQDVVDLATWQARTGQAHGMTH